MSPGLCIVLVFAAIAVSCTLGDQCQPNTGLCDGNTRRVCVRKDHGEKHSYYGWSSMDCGANAQCQEVEGDGSITAICAYGPPRPGCGEGNGFICDGTELLGCNSGYVVSWQQCLACATNGAECTQMGMKAIKCCQGKMGTLCEDDDECVQGLLCVPHPRAESFKECSLLCDCPNGSCPACLHSTSSRPQAICYDGVCHPG